MVAPLAAMSLAATAVLAQKYFQSNPQAVAVTIQGGDTELTLSDHAITRLQRGVTLNDLQALLEKAKPFAYFHENQWKLGYYDAGTKLFMGTVNGVVTTVITGASGNYISNMMAALPPN